ncbi:MAG TPA: transposase [Rhodanobacteraceae bacterium]|nr:transposase [Rhodanobacteraceae bacterium]
MPRYIRSFVPGGTFFFTVVLLDRRQRFLVDRIKSLRKAFAAVREKQPFTIDAAVILPDHLHCIWTLPAGDANFSSRWHAIKAAFSRAMPKGERLSARRRAKGERGVWQRRFWEHTIRDERDFERHADYIHYNPVKHGHTRRAADWPHSTFHKYVQNGVYAPDWGASDEVRKLDLE